MTIIGFEARLARSPGFSALALWLLLGCGGGAGAPSVSVAPEPRTVLVGDQLALSASPSAELAGDLAWEVVEPFGGGLRNSTGMSTVYFAPETSGTFHLILRAPLADGGRLKQTIEVRVLPIITVEPDGARLDPGGTVTFTASLKGLPRQLLKWAVEETDGGEIDQDGRYLAPARPGVYHVTAADASDSLAGARVTVTVK